MNNDTALLQKLVSGRDNQTAVIIDENSNTLDINNSSAQCLTNRFDISANRPNIIFNDFDFNAINPPVNTIIFRIAKEKAINLHVIHSALQLISHGELILIGYKNDGIKSLVKHTQALADIDIHISKHAKQLHQVHITIDKPLSIGGTDYHDLQTITAHKQSFISKPGTFGWKKIDLGSVILIEQLQQLSPFSQNTTVLDLGCGYGYLSINANKLGAKSIDATDNCAAAINACSENFEHNAIMGSVIPSDCGKSIQKKYDIVLCNPPFHQGFDHDKQITEVFTEQASKLCANQGKAYFVVNEFIGLEKWAKKYFKTCEIMCKRDGFKVLCLSK